ncbi:hypothetical protein [Paenibacillus donghaensis]|uniref:Uncharacterized protein n=1 Tax=Paenibacillus donghaensis TaxID=414771 RepID=A0A2Z2KJY2_9BACL|nr:hypothetical protein [Paenibacillus donghaensis]ASA21262.1 hypothetical protein B9T62_10975 [Paenibacillus donghaensis]
MLKLVKYDFRRRRDQLAAVLAIVILLQVAITITTFVDSPHKPMLNTMVYLIAALLGLGYAMHTYVQNLVSYQRRLLPVSTLHTLLSPIIFYWGLLIVLLSLGLVQLGILHITGSNIELPVNTGTFGFRVIAESFWSTTSLLVMFMFSFTLARSFRYKGYWRIGIFTYFVLQYLVVFVERQLFGVEKTELRYSLEINVIGDESAAGGNLFQMPDSNLGLIVFEVVLVLLLLAGMARLIRSRVES